MPLGRRLTQSLLACLTLLAFLLPSGAIGAPAFDAPFREWPGALEGYGFAMGDFDEDGLTDAVVAMGAPAVDLLFMKQLPGGRFEAAGTWGAAAVLTSLIAGDFDDDGHLDVAGLDWSGTLTIGYGDGLGGALSWDTRPAPLGAMKLATAELNGGGTDVLAISYSGARLAAFVSGLTPLIPAAEITLPASPSALDAGDIDHDGLDEVLVVYEGIALAEVLDLDTLGVLVGSFALAGASDAGSAATIADVTGDGEADLLVGTSNGSGVEVFAYTGPGTYTPSYFSGYPSLMVFGVLPGDLDGDGDVDLIVAGTHSFVLVNDGSGSFTSMWSAMPNSVHFSSAFDLLDFDGDGALDFVALGNFGACLLTARGNGDGHFESNITVDAGYADRAMLVNIDADPEDEFVMVGGWGVFGVADRVGNNFSPPTLWALPSSPLGLASGQFSPSTLLDFASASPSTGEAYVFRNQGAGVFLVDTVTTGEWPINVAAGDLDGDGLDDLVVVCGNNGETAVRSGRPNRPAALEGLSIHLSTGSDFAPPVFLPLSGNCPSSVVIANVMGSALPELLVALSCGGGFAVYPNLGGGSFGSPTHYFTTSSPSQLAVADLDLVVGPDVVTLASDGTVETLLNTGTGSFGSAESFPTIYGGNHMVVTDLDQDGLPDLAVLGFASVMAIHTGNILTRFEGREDMGTASAATGLIANDFDGDGDMDLLVPTNGDPLLQWHRNRAVSTSSAGPQAAAEGGLLALRAPMPNPARGGTLVQFSLAAAARTSVEVLDVSGRLVKRLQGTRALPAGTHGLRWDLTDGAGEAVRSGIYFVRVQAGPQAATRKVLVTR